MRKSREEAAESRQRIMASAGKLFRRRGLSNTSVADVMTDAGMTHGGFYRHFGSKAELSADAVHSIFDAIAAEFDRVSNRSGARAALKGYVDFYLSDDHIRNVERGCAMPSLGADAMREGKDLQRAFDAGVSGIVDRVGKALAEARGIPLKQARVQAIRQLTMMVGAVLTARAIGNSPLSKEIVAACRRPGAD